MDGLNSPAELVKAAKEAGQTAIAITDHGTLSSHREMQIACKDQGIKPILGVEAYISPTDRFDRSSKTDKSIQAYNHIILLAKNKKGLENINILQELAWNEGFYHKPRIDREVLNEYKEGIIVLSGCREDRRGDARAPRRSTLPDRPVIRRGGQGSAPIATTID